MNLEGSNVIGCVVTTMVQVVLEVRSHKLCYAIKDCTMVVTIQPIRLLTSRLINHLSHLSICLPTYRPRRRLIIFNLSTSLCALWVTDTNNEQYIIWGLLQLSCMKYRYAQPGCNARELLLLHTRTCTN